MICNKEVYDGGVEKLGCTSYAFGNYNHQTANAWEYTGDSFTVPSEETWLISFYCGWTNSACTGLWIASVNADIAANNIVARFELPSDATRKCILRTPAFMLPSGTYYIWENRVGTGNNKIQMFYKRI